VIVTLAYQLLCYEIMTIDKSVVMYKVLTAKRKEIIVIHLHKSSFYGILKQPWILVLHSSYNKLLVMTVLNIAFTD